jgi:hypothetical protein
MIVRRSPAIVLSLVLSAAALSVAPALAKDGGTAKDVSRNDCDGKSWVRLKLDSIDGNSDRFSVTGAVFSDDDDVWSWKMRHDGDLSADGEVRARDDIDRSFRVTRTMLDFYGDDDVVFRAENERTGEVCKISRDY